MSVLVDDIVIAPLEMDPTNVEHSLSAAGLSIVGADFGETTAKGTAAQTDKGIVLVQREPQTRTVTLKLVVREDAEVTLPEAAARLQRIVGALQARDEWFRRDHHVGGTFGSILYHITGEVTLADFAGWQVGDSPDVTLVMVCDFAAYSTTERESATFTSAAGDRHLEFTEAASDGSAKGLWRCRVKNEGPEDWRGLILSRECQYAPAELGDPTAKLHYLASELTPKGGALASAGPSPEVRAVGAIASGAGVISPGLPAGTQPGDLLIMIAESGGATALGEANTALTATGWASPPAPYAAQKKGNTRLTVLYRIATGGDATLTNDTGDHQAARIIAIKAGTFDATAPFNTAAVGTQAATKAVSIPGGTTTRDNCLILACASGNLPDATGTTEFGAATNADLTGLTEQVDNTFTAGDGGALYAATGIKAAKGVFGATTLTAVTEAERGVISLAINAPTYIEHSSLTAGWLTILSSEIVGVGHMTHQGPRRMWLRIYDPGSEAGDVQLQLFWRALGSTRWDEHMPIVSTPVVGGWMLIDLGAARPEAARLGDERWEWKLQARAQSGSGRIRIREVYPLSTEQYLVLKEPYVPPVADFQAAKSPTSVVDAAGIGSAVWVNPGNAKASDDSYAEVGFKSAGESSHYLQATNFGFSLPSSAVILGIIAQIERKKSGGGLKDNAVRIIKGGAIGGVDRSSPLSWPTSDEVFAYGSATDLWGEAWTVADIESNNFGLALSVVCVASSELAKVDSVNLVVFYSNSPAEDKVCFTGRSAELRSDVIARQHPTDDVWGQLVPDGFLPFVPPGGLNGRPTRGILIPTAGDFAELPDGNAAVSLDAVVHARDGYHYAREGP